MALPSMSKYKKTGFYTSANIASLQEQLANYKQSDADVRKQAESYYAPQHNMQQQAYKNQLDELDVSRDRDVEKVNSQFDKNLSGIMTGLNSRGMGRSSLVSTRGVENENARNTAVSETSLGYLQKENEINANIQQSQAEYAQNVENKAVEIQQQNQANYINLMSQIAQLQQSGYSAYVNYLLNK